MEVSDFWIDSVTNKRALALAVSIANTYDFYKISGNERHCRITPALLARDTGLSRRYVNHLLSIAHNEGLVRRVAYQYRSNVIAFYYYPSGSLVKSYYNNRPFYDRILSQWLEKGKS